MSDRCSFLCGLATLPLIGGLVALIGRPTASAVPVSGDLLNSYNEWLFYEPRMLCIEQFGAKNKRRAIENFVPQTVCQFHFPVFGDWRDIPGPSTRAAMVLAAVGAEIGEVQVLIPQSSIIDTGYQTLPLPPHGVT